MELHEAFARAIRAYYNKEGFEETNKVIADDPTERKGITYTLEFFDMMENGEMESEDDEKDE